MTEEELKKAAMRYCDLAGLDPNVMVAAPTPTDANGMTFDVYSEEPRWKSVARHIQTHFWLTQAIRFACGSEE